MTESLEKLLKQARVEKKLTINDISKELKIRKDYFKEFERKIPDQLGVYDLGYLRSYAKYLGVDIDPYLANKKAKANEKAEKNEETYTTIFVKAIKTPAGAITLVLSVLLAIASGMYLWNHQYDWRSFAEQPGESVLQEEHIIPVKSSLSIEKKGPHDYSITGITLDSDINIVARADTRFAITDPSKDQIISSGEIKAGERLFIPKAEASQASASLLIKTTVPDALEVQQITDDK